jgi:hypothetical protein
MDAGATFAEKGAKRDNFARSARHWRVYFLWRQRFLKMPFRNGSPWESFLIGLSRLPEPSL